MINTKIDLNCPYPQTYSFILTHKKFDEKTPDNFTDLANRIYISENGVPGTVKLDTGAYPTKCYGELGVWKWISQNIRDCDWAALNHNRRKIYPKVRYSSCCSNAVPMLTIATD